MSYRLAIPLAILLGCFIWPDSATATICNEESVCFDNGITTVFCNIIVFMSGPTGKSIATTAIIGVGLGTLFGRTSFKVLCCVCVGVALVFGANSIVLALSDDQDSHDKLLSASGACQCRLAGIKPPCLIVAEDTATPGDAGYGPVE